MSKEAGKKAGFMIGAVLPFCVFAAGVSIALPVTVKNGKRLSTPVISEVVTSSYRQNYDHYDLTSDWIEIGNPSDEPVSVGGYGLSDEAAKPFKFRLPDVSIPAGGYLVVRASGMEKNAPGELHAKFKLRQSGETLVLTSPFGRTADRISIPELPVNRSYGRTWSDPGMWAILAETSPGRPNADARAEGSKTCAVRANRPSGSFRGGFDLVLSTDDAGAVIRYTLDGSLPDLSSPVFAGRLAISSDLLPEKTLTGASGAAENYFPPAFRTGRAVVVRARAFAAGANPSDCFTAVYFTDDQVRSHTMPVLNVTADPRDLMDPNDGIYVLGEVYRQWRKDNPGAKYQGDTPANYNRRGDAWRIPVTADFFDGEKGFSRNAEMKIVGGWSRASPQKSFQLIFHSQDDPEGGLNYELFPGLESRDGMGRTVDFFRSVIFRNGGNDWPITLFRDPMIAGLLRDFPLDVQTSRPCIVYLNGEYWGILNMREAMDEGYFSSHYRVPMDGAAVFEGKLKVGDGGLRIGTQEDAAAYTELASRIREADFSARETFDSFGKEIDFRNHALYTAVQLWIANKDWPGNNIRFWKYTGRPESGNGAGARVDALDGRYRWLLYDTEFSMNIYEPDTQYLDMFSVITRPNGPDWPNPPWSTELFRRFTGNREYTRLLVNACCDLMNTVFSEAGIGSAVEAMEALYENEMELHQSRWLGAAGGSLYRWKSGFQAILSFARSRNPIFHGQMKTFFKLGDPVPVSIGVSEGGKVRLNNLTLSPGTFAGSYYGGNAVDLTAVPDSGWVFSRWSGSVSSNRQSVSPDPETGLSVTAIFSRR